MKKISRPGSIYYTSIYYPNKLICYETGFIRRIDDMISDLEITNNATGF